MVMPLATDALKTQEVAEYLHLAPEMVYRYIRQGNLVASRFGRRYRIPRENVEMFLLATSTAGDSPLRAFSDTQVDEWLEEDEIDGETARIGERLLAGLQKS